MRINLDRRAVFSGLVPCDILRPIFGLMGPIRRNRERSGLQPPDPALTSTLATPDKLSEADAKTLTGEIDQPSLPFVPLNSGLKLGGVPSMRISAESAA